MKCYNYVVCKHEKVDMVRFGKTMHWFGSLNDDDDNNILEKVYDIFREDWFFGIMDSEAAQARLYDHREKIGTYLVRCNDGEDCSSQPFRISVVNKDNMISHYRIKKRRDNFTVTIEDQSISEPSLSLLVEKAITHPNLKEVCNSRDFSLWFKKEIVGVYEDEDNKVEE